MPETPEQIGPYTIRSEIGRGGMGIVYLAHDARLSRDVAIKALPDHVTDSRDRLARFEREARALASLSHPNVAQIYGVEESEGRRYLVLEYVPGETLDGVLKRERLPVGEALQVCAQVAAGLEAAHDAGVIHRDLKPANVRVSDDGVVKVLDFGLALTNDEPPASADGSSESPTMTSPVHSPTMPGVILGTAPYMSPEQARGKRVDRRTDIWSFGVVLYECLTGTGPFAGETATDSLGAVLHKDIDLDALPVQTPPLVRHVLQRCLERDKSRRLRDIGDARIELEHAQALPATTPGNAFPTTGRAGSPLLVASLAIIAVGLLVALLLTIMQPTPQADTPFVVASIAMPDGMRIDSSMALNQVTVSGDGRMLAYIARDDSGAATLFLRELGSVEPTRIADVPSPRGVTFSPDGRFIACCDENARLLRLRTDGGPPEVIADISAWGWPNGPLSWQDDGRIYFSPERDLGLWAVDVESGELSTVRGIDAEAGLWGILPAAGPSPRSGGMLVHTWGGFRRSGNEVSWLDLASGTVTRLLQRASHPFAIDDRWLVFTRDSSIMVIPFDFDALQPLGEARVVIEGVSASSWSTDSVFAAAPSGTAMYVPGGRRGLGRRIVSIDPSGETTVIVDAGDAYYGGPYISPDGTRLAYSTLDDRLETWIEDRTTGARQRLVTEGELHHLLFSSIDDVIYGFGVEDGRSHLMRVDLQSGTASRFIEDLAVFPEDWAPDGRMLATVRSDDDISIVHINLETATVEPLIVTDDAEWSPALSPDGAWLIYCSYRARAEEIYVRRYPDGTRDWLVASGGASDPKWSGDGSIVYMKSADGSRLCTRTFSAPEAGGTPTIGPERTLLDTPSLDTTNTYSLAPDGDVVLLELAPWEHEPAPITLLLNWQVHLAELLEGE